MGTSADHFGSVCMGGSHVQNPAPGLVDAIRSGDVEPWSGRSLSTTVAAWAGSSPVVAGDLGGAVAVWVGVPAS